MPNVRIFMSFDRDNDEDLHDLLLEQSRRQSSGFEISARSEATTMTDRWDDKVRRQISAVDEVIVICGEHTASSDPSATTACTVGRGRSCRTRSSRRSGTPDPARWRSATSGPDSTPDGIARISRQLGGWPSRFDGCRPPLSCDRALRRWGRKPGQLLPPVRVLGADRQQLVSRPCARSAEQDPLPGGPGAQFC